MSFCCLESLAEAARPRPTSLAVRPFDREPAAVGIQAPHAAAAARRPARQLSPGAAAAEAAKRRGKSSAGKLSDLQIDPSGAGAILGAIEK